MADTLPSKVENFQSEIERRSGSRFPAAAPLTVTVGTREISGVTGNLSDRGMYFYLDLAGAVPFSGDFDFLFALPPEMMNSGRYLVRGKARVVRTEDAANQLTGVAAEVLHYSMQREDAVSD